MWFWTGGSAHYPPPSPCTGNQPHSTQASPGDKGGWFGDARRRGGRDNRVLVPNVIAAGLVSVESKHNCCRTNAPSHTTAGVGLFVPGALKTVIAGSLTSVIRSTLSPLDGNSRSAPVEPRPGIWPLGHKGTVAVARKEAGFSARAGAPEETHRIAAMMGISGFAFIILSGIGSAGCSTRSKPLAAQASPNGWPSERWSG